MSWRDETRRALVGPQVFLTSSAPEGEEPKLWFRPKKWGIQAQEAVDAFRRTILDSKETRGKARRFQELLQKCAVDDALDYTRLTSEEIDEVMDLQMALKVTEQYDLIKTALESGVGDHNFPGEDGQVLNKGFGLPKGVVQEIVSEWGVMALEMFRAIQGWNAPLGQQGSAKSGRSPAGSSTEPGSPKTAGSWETVPTPAS